MKSLQGHLLVASPRLIDPNFFHTVVLLVQHNDEGALGLVLNRPLSTTVAEMWREVAEHQPCDVEGTLCQGGPCEGPLMVVHKDELFSEIEVVPGVFFCTRKDTIEKFVGENATESKFFVGYAGWSPGQLEAEMGEGSWLTTPARPEQIFSADEHLWSDLVRKLSLTKMWPGLDPGRIPEDPSVN
ncbi:MAG: YqgE/AlgH family protein [Phycisphaerae bacterium]|nr:YqgE/AlgH family protein [Tepidisphaeraceae bacterium]